MKQKDLIRGLAVIAMATVLTSGGVGSVAQGATTGTAPAQSEQGVGEGVIDNDPNRGDEKRDIHAYLVNLIEGAADDSEVIIASYRFNDEAVADALIDAVQPDRRVKVRVLVDYVDADKQPFLDLRDAIEEAGASGSEITTCGWDWEVPEGNDGTSCNGDHIMHNKFYLFEETLGTPNVVVQTSANLNEHSGEGMWNTAYTAVRDDWLYGRYEKYHKDMLDFVKNDDYYHADGGPAAHGRYKIYHSPRKEGNTFKNILDNVKCHGNTSGGTSDNHRTIVRVSMWQIAGANATPVADKLWELDDQGCYVDIVATRIGHGTRGKNPGPLEALLRAPTDIYHGPEVRELSSSQCGVHEKNIMIDGHYAGDPNQKVVFTGSHNLNNKSLRHNDETILRIKDESVHDAFVDNFFEVRAAAAITWQTSKYETTDPYDLEFNC